jgi:hypothetical protein
VKKQLNTLRILPVFNALQMQAHQLVSTENNIDYVEEVSTASALLIRLSWVRPPHVPPLNLEKPLCINVQSGFFVGACRMTAPCSRCDARTDRY